MNNQFYQRLTTILDKEHILIDEPMSKHTTFRIGGAADYFVIPTKTRQVKAIVELCREMEMPYYIIGNGSNLLIGDKGYRGVMIQIFKEFDAITVEGNRVTAQAGALLSKVAASAYDASLTGFEFASGIPGTIGGAVVMNAGAYGGEMKDIVESVTMVKNDGSDVVTLSAEKMALSYRHSILEETRDVAITVTLKLQKGNHDEIAAKMADLTKRRNEKQPVQYPSAGSFFKRPEGYFAGKLIQDAGLKGLSVGGAQVSDQHSGFIINRGDATATDIIELMHLVQNTVYDKFGVRLEPEVRIIGD